MLRKGMTMGSFVAESIFMIEIHRIDLCWDILQRLTEKAEIYTDSREYELSMPIYMSESLSIVRLRSWIPALKGCIWQLESKLNLLCALIFHVKKLGFRVCRGINTSFLSASCMRMTLDVWLPALGLFPENAYSCIYLHMYLTCKNSGQISSYMSDYRTSIYTL